MIRSQLRVTLLLLLLVSIASSISVIVFDRRGFNPIAPAPETGRAQAVGLKPDLITEFVNVEPPYNPTGAEEWMRQWQLAIAMKNQGGVNITQEFPLTVYLDGERFDTMAIKSQLPDAGSPVVGAGSSYLLKIPISAALAQDSRRQWAAVADRFDSKTALADQAWDWSELLYDQEFKDNMIDESDESNNAYPASFTITRSMEAAATPLLVVDLSHETAKGFSLMALKRTRGIPPADPRYSADAYEAHLIDSQGAILAKATFRVDHTVTAEAFSDTGITPSVQTIKAVDKRIVLPDLENAAYIKVYDQRNPLTPASILYTIDLAALFQSATEVSVRPLTSSVQLNQGASVQTTITAQLLSGDLAPAMVLSAGDASFSGAQALQTSFDTSVVTPTPQGANSALTVIATAQTTKGAHTIQLIAQGPGGIRATNTITVAVTPPAPPEPCAPAQNKTQDCLKWVQPDNGSMDLPGPERFPITTGNFAFDFNQRAIGKTFAAERNVKTLTLRYELAQNTPSFDTILPLQIWAKQNDTWVNVTSSFGAPATSVVARSYYSTTYARAYTAKSGTTLAATAIKLVTTSTNKDSRKVYVFAPGRLFQRMLEIVYEE